MSEQKHTPGPWEVCNGTDVYPVGDMDARHFIADCDPDNAPINNDGGHPSTDADYDEAKANARLIAAAPDMLDALKLAFYQMVGLDMAEKVKENGWSWPEDAPPTVSMVAENARAAISKALTP